MAVLALAMMSPAAASGVSIDVDTALDAELLLTDQEHAPDRPKTVAVEARNIGSKSFTGRIRLDVTNDRNETVFRTWSDVLQLTPGSTASHRFLFYHPQRNGPLTASTVLHHGTERVTESFTVNTTVQEPDDGFSLRTLRTKEDTVRAVIAVPDDVDAFAVTVNDASTRRFAQRRVRPSDGVVTVDIPYHPTIPDEADAVITISSVDGRYHYTAKRTLTRQEGFAAGLTGWLTVMLENLPVI